MISPSAVERLIAALANLAISGVTAGANPQRDGSMSPPLWHMTCALCGARWARQQWKQPIEHPPSEDRVFRKPCLLSPDELEELR